MKTKHLDSYESYYEHLCCLYEKDVLNTDIKGKSCLATLKRMWYDLFLLSYTDTRSRHYYRSSHAMKMARAMHFRLNRDCIHPLSKFRNHWEFFILHVLILCKILFHQNTSLIVNSNICYYYAAICLEVITIVDLCVNAKTGYTIKTTRQVVIDSHRIIIHYLSTTLFIHVASGIPLHAIMFLRYGKGITCSACKANKFVGTLKILNVISTFRVFEASKYWDMERSSFKKTYVFKFVRITVNGMIVILQILTFVDGLSIIRMVHNRKIEEGSWLSVILNYRYGGDMQYTPSLFFCVLEFSRICKSFLLFGYGLQPNETTFDQLCGLAVFAVAYLFHIWSYITWFTCTTRQTFAEDQIILNQSRTLNIFRARKLPDIIHTKVLQFYRCKLSALNLTEHQNGLFLYLPQTVKTEIKLSCYRRYLTRVPCFVGWPFELMAELVMLLRVETFLSGDVVASAQVPSDGLIIVELGMLAIYSVQMVETGHLIDGDFFGELSLVTDKEMRMHNVVAITHCSVLFLSKTRFRKLMRNYPQLFFDLKQKLLETYDQRFHRREPSTEGDLN